jgi:hypothetical protein
MLSPWKGSFMKESCLILGNNEPEVGTQFQLWVLNNCDLGEKWKFLYNKIRDKGKIVSAGYW